MAFGIEIRTIGKWFCLHVDCKTNKHGLFDISLSQTKPEKVISAKSIHCNYIELKEIRRKSFKKHDDL